MWKELFLVDNPFSEDGVELTKLLTEAKATVNGIHELTEMIWKAKRGKTSISTEKCENHKTELEEKLEKIHPKITEHVKQHLPNIIANALTREYIHPEENQPKQKQPKETYSKIIVKTQTGTEIYETNNTLTIHRQPATGREPIPTLTIKNNNKTIGIHPQNTYTYIRLYP